MIRFVYAVLLLVAVLAVFSFLNLAWKDVRVETRTVKEDPGKPTATAVPGEEINANLKGTTCDIWQGTSTITIKCSAAATAAPAA